MVVEPGMLDVFLELKDGEEEVHTVKAWACEPGFDRSDYEFEVIQITQIEFDLMVDVVKIRFVGGSEFFVLRRDGEQILQMWNKVR